MKVNKSNRLKSLEPFLNVTLTPAREVVYGAFLALSSTLLQSAGMLGGLGLVVSAFSTLPILLACLLSIKLGFLTYIVSFILIGIIQPSELFSFPFTTGLLGVSIGIGFRIFRKGFLVAIFSGLFLTLGILFLLQVIQFPVLGPSVTGEVSMTILIFIILFSIIYSWLWIKSFLFIVTKLNRVLQKRI